MHVDFITITGNKRTKDFVILREMVLFEQSNIDRDSLTYLLEMSNNRIMNLNLFNSVTIDTLSSNNGLLIKVIVIEKWYNWPIPFIEFSDRNFNIWKDLSFDPTRTNYGVYLFNYNVLGRNHTLKTSFVYGYNKTYGLEYRVPFLSRKSNIGVSTKIKYTSQSEMWLETKNDKLVFYKNGNSNLIDKTQAEVKINKRFAPYKMGYASVGFVHTKLDTSLTGVTDNYLLNAQLERTVFESSLSLDIDTRNNIYLPTTGQFFQNQVKLQYFNRIKPIANLYISSKAQHFNHIKNRWFSAISIFGDYNTSSTLPYENSRRFGYDYIVRGFERYVVEGRASILTNAAIRYQFVKQQNISLPIIPIRNYNFLPITSFAEIFLDAGAVSSSNILIYNNLPNELLYSGGLSIQTIFYNDRILRLEYSLNSLKESGFFVHFKKAI